MTEQEYMLAGNPCRVIRPITSADSIAAKAEIQR